MADVFVFGSNLRGIHGAGAALEAKIKWGAQQGIGRGRTGNAYAIPIKKEPVRGRGANLSLDEIRFYVDEFLRHARFHEGDTFHVTAVGCGLAGFLASEIGPMFLGRTSNVRVPGSFVPYCGKNLGT